MSHKSFKGTPKSSRDSIQSPSLLQQCVKCDVFLNSKDRAKHTEKVCQALSASNLINGHGDERSGYSASAVTNHGYIKNQTLYAKLEDIELKDKDLVDIPENFHDCLILVHYNSLEALSLKEGDSVAVTKSDGLLGCFIVWPHFTVRQPCSACLFGKPVDDGDEYVAVNKIVSPCIAKSLTLSFSNATTIHRDPVELISQLRARLRNRCVFNNMVLEINHSNADWQLKCSEIMGEQDLNSCLNSLSRLSMNGLNTSLLTPDFFIVRPETRIVIASDITVKFEDIGGLDKQIASLRELIELPLKLRNLVQEIGISPPRGVLIYGVPGTGKTMTMKAFTGELSSSIFFIKIDGASVLCKNYGETEAKIRSLFDLAREQQPSVVFIDDLDNLCSSRKSNTDQEKKVLATILTLMDDLSDGVVVIGITNKPESIDASLRRPGRFDREVEFPVPQAAHRIEIFKKILAKCKHGINVAEIELAAELAYSFTGADLVFACREASLFALKENRSQLTTEDLKRGLRCVKPSAMREIMLEVPRVNWSDIGGMREVKQKLLRMVVWPLKHPESFTRLGIMPPRGILMYGPPGCSKTMVGKALATESKLNFIAIKGPELFNKWVGESERAVREVFRKAKQASPAILFFDEIDALAAERGSSSGSSTVGDRVLAQLLTEMDGVEILDGVIIVAATNRPDIIDQALLRPGRLDSVIYVPLPDFETRKEIFEIRTRSMPLDKAFVGAPEKLAELTSGYSGAEITAVCQEAGLLALQKDINATHVAYDHFHESLTIVRPRTSPERVKFYEEYADRNKMVK